MNQLITNYNLDPRFWLKKEMISFYIKEKQTQNLLETKTKHAYNRQVYNEK